ncbi:MAG: metal-sensitive transcriptional regulator [Candidatus Dormibacteraeota bacterium]|nr:metal-sensitive transcriptional regulator [Candidatus Dormibacteraeota bacterium]
MANVVGYSKDKQKIGARLKRIEGQVRGIQRMVEADRYCIDVLTQVNAVKAALESVALELLEDHMDSCVSDAVRSGNGREKIREVTATIERFVRG